MTSPTPPPGGRSAGRRRRVAVDYQQLGYDVDELPAAPAAAAPHLMVTPVVVQVPDAGVITHATAAAVPPDDDLEEEQWWARGEDIPAPPSSARHAEPLPPGSNRQRPAGAASPLVTMLSRILGLDRLGSPRAAAAPGPAPREEGPEDPAWLQDLPDTDTHPDAGADGQGPRAGVVAAAADASPPDGAVAAARPAGVGSSRVVSADLEVSRAPRELGATLRRALVGVVLVLIAFAGIKQVIWNPIFGRSGPVAAGPAVLDQVAADAAATRYALDYLSFSPRTATTAAAAVSADVVGGGDDAPAPWVGTGYVRADAALPTGWEVVDPTRAVVAVTVRVHLAMPPAAVAGSSTPQALAALAPATVAAPAKAAAPKPATTPAQHAAAKSTPPITAPPTPAAAATHVAPAPVVSAPASVATAPLSTPAAPSGSASDPGAVPAGWTDLGSRWLTVAVPVQSSGGGVKVSAPGAILTGEPVGQIGAPAGGMPDAAAAAATASVATAFFTAYAQSNVAYLAQPGVNLTGLSGAVTLASLANWTVTVPTAPGSGSTPTTPTSGVGAGTVTWQLTGTDLQIQQNYAIALTSSQNRWYIAGLSPTQTPQP